MKISELRDKLKPLAALAPVVARDAPGLAGAGLLVHGVHLIYAPAAWIVAGVFGLVFSALLAAPRKPED